MRFLAELLPEHRLISLKITQSNLQYQAGIDFFETLLLKSLLFCA